MTRSHRTSRDRLGPWRTAKAAALLLMGVSGCEAAATQSSEAKDALFHGPVGVYGHIAFLDGTAPSTLGPLSYELLDSERAVRWRCAEQGADTDNLPECTAFPIAAGRAGVFMLHVRYVGPAGAARTLTVPFEVDGGELRIDVTLHAIDGEVWLRSVGSWFEAPPGVSIEHDADENTFRVVNDSAFDLVVTGYDGAFGTYVAMSTPQRSDCGICGTGVHAQVVRRGESTPVEIACGSVAGPGRYAVVMSARLRAPDLPIDLPPGCDSPCPNSDVDQVPRSESQLLTPVAIWTEVQVDAHGHAPQEDAERTFRDWLRRHPPVEPWPSFE